jgi:hypothetical protein
LPIYSTLERFRIVHRGGDHGHVHALRAAGAGRSDKVPPNTPLAAGDQIFIINRVLVDKKGNQKGTFVLHGTIVQVLSPADALMSFQGSNNIFNKGLINTQGVVKFSDLAAGVTFAIVGGTGKFKNARGTVTVKTPMFTYRVK